MIDKRDEALKLALEGAANYIDALGGDSRKYRQALAEQPAQQPSAFGSPELQALILAKALKQPAQQQEPVGHVSSVQSGSPLMCNLTEWERKGLIALYTSPPASKPWVGLTGEEIQTLWRSSEHMTVNDVCRAIEAKLREKNA